MPRATWDGCRSRAARSRSRRARSASISSPRRRAPARATPTCGECCGSNGEAASSAHRGGSDRDRGAAGSLTAGPSGAHFGDVLVPRLLLIGGMRARRPGDRKSTRLDSSHSQNSYAVFCLKKNNNNLLYIGPLLAFVAYPKPFHWYLCFDAIPILTTHSPASQDNPFYVIHNVRSCIVTSLS